MSNLSEKKKNILQVVFSGLGGTSAVAFSIVEGSQALKDKDNNFSFLFNGVEKLLTSHIKICKNLSIKYNFILKKNFFINFILIIQYLFKNKFHVIVVHDFPLTVFFICKFILRFQLIYVHHTPDLTKGFKYWFLYIVNSFFADKTVVVSKRKKSSFFNKLNRFLFLKPNVIINGINKDYFLKKKVKKTNIFKIGMAARFHSDKRHDLLIKLFKNFQVKFRKNKARLFLAGDGPTRSRYVKYVKKHKLENLIYFEGNLNQSQMKKWYKKLNLYVHLSKDETSSTSILQALSTGIPVISSGVGGNFGLRKKYKNIYNILLVGNNTKIIYQKINKIYQSFNLQQKMSISARRSVDLYFNSKIMFKQYSKLFKK